MSLTVLALHAFTRAPAHLDSLSEACQRRGWNCLRPALAPRWVPILVNSRRHLDRIADRLLASGRLQGPVVIVGHSAGAAAGTWMAPRLVRGGVDVRGVVYVDGNDSPNHLIEKALPQIASIPVVAITAPRGPCNRHGALANYLDSVRPGSVVEVPGAGHGDLEMRPSMLYRRACGDTSGPAQWMAVRDEVLDAVGRVGDRA